MVRPSSRATETCSFTFLRGQPAELLAALFPVRPYQLPADLADFTGREAEICSLLKSLRAT